MIIVILNIAFCSYADCLKSIIDLWLKIGIFLLFIPFECNKLFMTSKLVFQKKKMLQIQRIIFKRILRVNRKQNLRQKIPFIVWLFEFNNICMCFVFNHISSLPDFLALLPDQQIGLFIGFNEQFLVFFFSFAPTHHQLT